MATKIFTLSAEQEVIKRFEELAKERGLNKSKYFRILIQEEEERRNKK